MFLYEWPDCDRLSAVILSPVLGDVLVYFSRCVREGKALYMKWEPLGTDLRRVSIVTASVKNR